MTTENGSQKPGSGAPDKRRGRKKDDTPVVVVRTYDFVLWLLPKVEQFPRSFRFSIGDRLVSGSLDLLLLLVEAAYAKDKAAALDAATRRTNTLSGESGYGRKLLKPNRGCAGGLIELEYQVTSVSAPTEREERRCQPQNMTDG